MHGHVFVPKNILFNFLHMPVLLYSEQEFLLKSHEYACTVLAESGRLLVGTCY